MVCAGSPTTHRSSRSPTHRSSSRCCSGVDVLVLVDDEVPVLRRAPPGRSSSCSREDADREQQHVLEVDDAALGLDLLVGLDAGAPWPWRRGRGRLAALGGAAAAAYVSGVSIETLAHSTSAARSRIAGAVRARSRRSDAAGLGDGARPSAASPRAPHPRWPAARSSAAGAARPRGRCGPAPRRRRGRAAGCASRRRPGR